MQAKCATCGKPVEETTLYKRRVKGEIFCFCSPGCKEKFEQKHGLPDMM